MSIDAILDDKQPIIEELTARLRSVAEGAGGTDKGLGLRIVTVQVKEAVVSSRELWEALQKPFRAERSRIARLAELEAQESVTQKELGTSQRNEAARVATERELSSLRAQAAAEVYDREQSEKARRAKTEQENARALAQETTTTHLKNLALDKQRHVADVEFAQQKADAAAAAERRATEANLGLEQLKSESSLTRAKLHAEAAALHQAVDNALTPAGLQARMLEKLPSYLEKLPKPAEVRSVSIGQGDALPSAVAQVMAVISSLSPDKAK